MHLRDQCGEEAQQNHLREQIQLLKLQTAYMLFLLHYFSLAHKMHAFLTSFEE